MLGGHEAVRRVAATPTSPGEALSKGIFRSSGRMMRESLPVVAFLI